MLKSFGVIGTTAVFIFLGLTVPAYSRQEQQDKPKNEETKQQGRPAEKQQQSSKPARQDQSQDNKRQDQQRQQQPQPSAQQNLQHQQSHQTQDNSANQQQQAKAQKQATQDSSAKSPQQQAKGQQSQPRQQQRQPQDKPVQQQQVRGPQDQKSNRPQQQDSKSVQQRSPDQVHQQQVAWEGDRAHDWKSEHRSWQQRGGYNGYRVPDARFRADYGQDHGFRIFSLPVMFVGGDQRFQYGGYWFGLIDPWPEYWSSNWYDNDDVYVDYYGDGYYLYNRRYPGDRIAISFYVN